ncbi:hypothetical protein AALA21_00855 [Eggerthellaceae bacterium 3-80]|nr:hypothetical protein D7W09_01460 [bacterium D16-34]
MYRELTHKDIVRKRRNIICAVVLAVLVVVLASFAFSTASAQARQQSAASVREAILDAAMQCCAIEGSYPQTLQYLEENYGLRINEQDYVITYEVFANNVIPSVVVVPR